MEDWHFEVRQILTLTNILTFWHDFCFHFTSLERKTPCHAAQGSIWTTNIFSLSAIVNINCISIQDIQNDAFHHKQSIQRSISPLYAALHLDDLLSPKEAWCPREEVHCQMKRLCPLTRSYSSRTRFGSCTHCFFLWESVHSAEDDQYCQEERRLRGGKE